MPLPPHRPGRRGARGATGAVEALFVVLGLVGVCSVDLALALALAVGGHDGVAVLWGSVTAAPLLAALVLAHRQLLDELDA